MKMVVCALSETTFTPLWKRENTVLESCRK